MITLRTQVLHDVGISPLCCDPSRHIPRITALSSLGCFSRLSLLPKPAGHTLQLDHLYIQWLSVPMYKHLRKLQTLPLACVHDWTES